MGFIIREFIWDIHTLIFAYVLFQGPIVRELYGCFQGPFTVSFWVVLSGSYEGIYKAPVRAPLRVLWKRALRDR